MESQPEQIDLNLADVEQLAQLPGIGPTLAERIVNQRQSSGPFADIQDLEAIHGISEAMVQDIAEYLTVGDVEATESPEDVSRDDEALSLDDVGPSLDDP